MRHTMKTRVAAGVLGVGMVAGLVAAAPVAAFAASPGSTSSTTTDTTASSAATAPPSNPACTPALFSAAQQRVETALSGRVTQLEALQGVVNNTVNHLTTSDRQALQNSVTNVELPGIKALQPQVQQATTCPALRAAARAMVFDYRVYVVMTPQTHLTVVADDETYIEGVFVNLETTISQAIADAQANGKNVTAAQAAFSDLKSQVATAQSESTGQDSTLLAQTPEGAPGNWQVFLASRTSLSNARNDLRAAYSDAQQIRTDLQ